ncbi:MAG: TonB-dependent receptor [Bacteroidota bacterium]
MTRKFTLLYFLFFVTIFSFAQSVQTVRGKIFDAETNYPLSGAKIYISVSDSTTLKAMADPDGQFAIENVPTGKFQLSVELVTYEPKAITIEVNSGKETIVNIPMTERYVMQEEVVVTARKQGEVINEMAVVSAQQFSVEETNRYPGSRSDPARMASNFAGVQGADDSRNDIVVRGNSPLGILWKVEGVDIPNPSHFAIAGSTGGPVSILNNKILGNSDFFMSAFPAEYGNSTSGVFDLKLRNGNNKVYEFTGQFGLLGTEFLSEGPMSKSGKSSYLVMGRYSTLNMFKLIGIKLGTDAVPGYFDGAFKFNWSLKKGGALSFFGIGGRSKIDIMISEQTQYSDELYGQGDRDQHFGTGMVFTGFNYKKSLSEKSFINATVSYSLEEGRSHHEYIYGRQLDSTQTQITFDSIRPIMGYVFQTHKVSGFFSFNHKFNPRHLLKAGVNVDGFYWNMLDSGKVIVTDANFTNRWDFQGSAALIQPFIQWKFRVTENMDFTAGLHSQYFSLNNSVSIVEPRIGWKWRMKKDQSLFAGAGMHSGTQPYYTYFYHKFDGEGNKVLHNKNMGFTRSLHSAIGYEKVFKKKLNIRTEVYYQYLYDVPVTIEPSSFSLINMGGGFSRIFPDSLENTGTGYNYGIELTIQKYFDKSFFVMFSSSLYSSKYKGSDGILRNTSYNGNYIFNLLGGYEFKLNAKHSLTAGLKITYAGGKRYGVPDDSLSAYYDDLIYRDSAFNELQFRDYFRLDLKISWRMNANRVTHEFGLDLVNILNTKNLLGLAYAPNLADPTAAPIAERLQLGFLPIFYYKIDFKVKKKE